MQESEYLNIRVTNKTRLPLLIKEIFASNKQHIRLLIDEPVEWISSATQLRFFKHKLEEQGKKIVIATNNQQVIDLARAASVEVHTRAEQEQSNAPTMQDTVPVKKQRQPTTSASVTISKKDKQDPQKDRVVIKSEYALSDKEATGKFAFSPKKGTEHIVSVKKQVTGGLFSNIFKKNKQPQTASKNASTQNSMFQTFIGGLVKRKKITFIATAITAVVILVVLFATNVLPSATIRLTPHTREESVSYNFIASANISTNNFQENSIPSQVIESVEEKTYKTPTTGTQELEEYAEGEITIYNEYGSETQTLVQGTRFAASNGKVFRIIDQVTVPGASLSGGKIVPSSITVKVRAYEAGESYNIGPSSFSIPGFRTTDKYYKFYGESKNNMTGGVAGTRQVVTQKDIDTIRQRAREEMFNRVQAELRKKIPDGFIAVEETLRNDFDIQKENKLYGTGKTTPKVGDIADELVMQVVARARIVLIRETDARALFEEYIATQDVYDSEQETPGDTQTIEYAVRENDYNQGITRLTMNVTQSFRRIIDTDALFAEIAGKKDIEVRRILSNKDEFQRVYLRFWPFWVNKIPSDRQDVEFDIQYID